MDGWMDEYMKVLWTNIQVPWKMLMTHLHLTVILGKC